MDRTKLKELLQIGSPTGPPSPDFEGKQPRIYAALAASPEWSLRDDVQDSASAPATVNSGRRRLVWSLSTPAGQGAARRAHERIQGHFNYFAVSENFRSLLLLVEHAKKAWYKWLRRLVLDQVVRLARATRSAKRVMRQWAIVALKASVKLPTASQTLTAAK